MRIKITTLFLFVLSFLDGKLTSLDSTPTPHEEKPFLIIVSGCNEREWYKQNLDSIFNQNYTNYRVIYVEKEPSDGTTELILSYIKQKGIEHKIKIERSRCFLSPVGVVAKAAFAASFDEIIVEIAGRDWLAHDEVLNKLNALYQNPDTWMTYGQFLYYPLFTPGFAREIPQHVVQGNTFRLTRGISTLPRSFYAGLFQKIKKEDLLFEERLINAGGDLAYTIPLIEMAGNHAKFISEALYILNYTTPLPEHLIEKPADSIILEYLSQKTPYKPVQSWKPILHQVYAQVDNILNPSLNDYRIVQDFLSHGKRDTLPRLKDMEFSVRGFKMIGESPQEFPLQGIIPVNCPRDQRENCILLYSSFNRNFSRGLKRLIENIRTSDFRGQILYQLGGWPNTEEGDLTLAHVPYAFKASFFKKAERMGFKKAFWLDTSIVPLVSLNTFFDKIEEKGYFIMGNTHNLRPYINPLAAAYFGLDLEHTNHIPSCSAGIFGVDFTQPIGVDLIEDWYRAAHDSDAFYSARSDQNALSILLYQKGIEDFTSIDLMPHSTDEIKENSLLLLDREYTR